MKIMKITCPPGYHHSGSMATHGLGTHGVRNRTPWVPSPWVAIEPLW